MHYYIRELDHDVKFCYNYNSSYAYDDGIPKQWPGLKKGKEATKAYNVEKKIFQKAAEKTLGLPIGNFFISWKAQGVPYQKLHLQKRAILRKSRSTVHYAPETFKLRLNFVKSW